MSLPVPPFQIVCAFHEGPKTDLEKFSGWKPSESDLLYLSIRTPQNEWATYVKRGEMQKLFDAINANLKTPIEFGEPYGHVEACMI